MRKQTMFLISDSERKALDKFAKKRQASFSEFIRYAALYATKTQVKSVERKKKSEPIHQTCVYLRDDEKSKIDLMAEHLEMNRSEFMIRAALAMAGNL